MRVYAGAAVRAFSLVILSGMAAGSGRLAAQAPARGNFAATIESSDPRLAAALLFETIAPTAQSHLRVAREYHRLHILDSAHSRVELALRREPGLGEAHEEMARLWRDWGFLGRALGAAHRAVYFAPRAASGHNTLGTVLDALGQGDAARQAYLAAVRLDPSAGWALNNLCSLDFRMGRLAEAQRQCEDAVRATPALVAAHNNLGLTLAASGRLDAAREAFLAFGDVAAAHYNVGVVHLANGDYLAAALEFEQAIKERPTFTAAKTRAHEARIRVYTNR